MITRPAPVAPAKQRASNHIRRLAEEVQRTFPDMTVHQHLTDAARENDAGRFDNAKRHLDAAVASFAPLQLIRHGIHDDEGHRAAKNFMQQAHRGRLLVQDTEGIRGENDGLMERRRDQAASALQARAMKNAQPQPTGRVDRNVTTPGATAASPPALGPGTAKQYAWEEVLSAIELATFAGKKPGSGHNFAKLSGSLARRGVKDPDALAAYIGRKKYGARKFAKLGHAVPTTGGIELVGPKGYIHGWIKVGQAEAGKLKRSMERGASVMGGGYPGERGKLGQSYRPSSTRPSLRERLAEHSLGSRSLRDEMQKAGYALDRARGRARGGWGDPFQASRGRLGDQWKPGQATETAASGAGFPLETRKNPFENESMRMQWAMQHPQATTDAAKKAATYKALRATGHSHSAAMNIVRGTFRQIGRAFQAGSATESVTQQYAWEDVLDAIELSAQTGRLASEPHPFGKPGGPGLWNVKGMELPPYIQNIARALLRTGRAKDLSQAIAIAKGATNRWGKGGGHVSPEVRAASAKTNASWAAKQATAHAHANDPHSWYELTGTAAGAAKDQRIAAGSAGGGRFGSGGGAAAGGKAAPAQSRAQRKAALLAQAKQDRAQAKLLLIRIAADRKALASASGKVTKGQKGSVTTAAKSKTGTSAPAAKGAAAAASPTSAKNTGLTPAAIAKATASATTAAHKMSKQQLTQAIKALTVQEKNLLAAAVKATQAASKL